MTQQVANLLAEAMRLPDNDRADLAAQLIDSLDPEKEEDAEAAWSREIQSRIDDLRSGREKPIVWSEACRQIMGESDDGTSP